MGDAGGVARLRDFVGRRADPDWGPTLGVRSLRSVIGKEAAAKWARKVVENRQVERELAEIGSQIKALQEPRRVLPLGQIGSAIMQFKPQAITDQIVLTGERRQHYLTNHPDVADVEASLGRLVLDPDEVHRNKTSSEMLVFYRRHGDSYLRAAVWISQDATKQNSVHSFRWARAGEVEAGRRAGRSLWRKK